MNFILNELSITISAHFLGANSGSSLLLEETKSSSSDSFFDKLSKESFSVSDNLVSRYIKLDQYPKQYEVVIEMINKNLLYSLFMRIASMCKSSDGQRHVYTVVKLILDENLTKDFEEEFLCKNLFNYLICYQPSSND